MGRVTLGKHCTLWMQLSHPWTALTQRESYHDSCCLSLLTVTLPLLRDFLLKKKKWFFFFLFSCFFIPRNKAHTFLIYSAGCDLLHHCLFFTLKLSRICLLPTSSSRFPCDFFFKSLFSVPHYFLRQQDGPGPPWTFLHLPFLRAVSPV